MKAYVWIVLAVASCQRTSSEPPPAKRTPPGPAPVSAQPQPVAPKSVGRNAPPLPDPLPGTRTNLTTAIGSAFRAVIADLDGDGTNEIITADATDMRVLRRDGSLVTSAPLTAGIQRLVAADLDGDRRAEIYAGWGQTREHMDSHARLTMHTLQNGKLVEETIASPETTRNDVAQIVPMPDAKAVLFAYFDSKYNVSTLVAKRGTTWETQPLASIRTATSYARGDVNYDGTPDIVVGRVYGDDKASDGDAFVLGPDNARTKIPSTRGMRSIAVADGDGDGKAEVFLGDGWHQNYGETARGLLTWARFANGAFTSELIEDTAGQYALDAILPATIDGTTAIVTLGNAYVRVFIRTNNAWRGLTIGGAMRDIAVGDLDGAPGDEVLLVGERSEVVKLTLGDWK